MKKFHSKDIKYLYDDVYFLGGKSKHTDQMVGVEGFQEFADGKIYQKKIDCADLLNFKGKNVLDIGFGRGEVLKYCSENGANRCIGTDYSESALKIAGSYLPEEIKLYNLAVDELCYMNECDINVIYMLDILEHVPDAEWADCFKQIKYKLNKDCELLATTPSFPCGDYLQMHNNYMTTEKINNLFCPIFSEVNIQNNITSPGRGWFHITCKEIRLQN